MAGFNYSALISPGGLSEQLGHLAGTVAQANATNRATDVASRRADIDQAFREAQLQHYKNMEGRQGLSAAMNPLQQAAMKEHESKAAYYDHLTNKPSAAPKPPANQVPFPIPGISIPPSDGLAAAMTFPQAPLPPPHPGIQYPGENPDGSPLEPRHAAPPSMLRGIQDVIKHKVADHLKNGGDAASAMQMQRDEMAKGMAPGYALDPATHMYMSAPPPPHGDPAMGAPGVPPPGSGGPVEPEANPLFPTDQAAPAAPQGGGGLSAALAPGAPMPGNPGMAIAAPLTGADMHPTGQPGGGLGQAMLAPMPAPQAPAPAAPPAAPSSGKVISDADLQVKAKQLFGGDIHAAAQAARAHGHAVNPAF